MALALDHDVSGLDVPVVKSHFLHFGEEPDHLCHEVPHFDGTITLDFSDVDVIDFLLQCPVTEFHDDSGFIRESFF